MELGVWFSDVLRQMGRNLVSVDWVANELPSFLLFTVAVGCIVWGVEKWRERRERRPYENWRLVVIGLDDPPQEQALYFEEVRKLLKSEFELFRFVKTVCTTICKINTKSLAKAQQDWVSVDREKRARCLRSRRTMSFKVKVVRSLVPAGFPTLGQFAACDRSEPITNRL